MPIAAPRPCTHPGCSALVRDGSGRCPKHPRAAWSKSPWAAKRITGRRLQQARAELFERQPLCVLCLQAGRVREATARDHVVPLSEEGPDDDTNVQALCATCHEAKTREEARRGAARARGG